MRGRARGALIAVVVAVGLASTACRTGSQVRWTTYQPALQQRIDAAAVAGECRVLGVLRRFAEATSTAHQKATGYPNDALVGYIDDAQRRAEC
jgi:hypothetical protein